MMLSSASALIAFVALASAAAVQPAANVRAQSICGDLGVMDIQESALPKIATLQDLRMCANHPLGRNRTLDPAEGASLAPKEGEESTDVNAVNPLQERACYHAAPYGCSKGYCWKACGDKAKGEWCWTAGTGGVGSWATCKAWSDCGTNSYTFGCGKGCVSCGCSC